MSHSAEIPKTPTTLGPEHKSVEAELSTMGATYPALWMAFFEMGQAIQASKPIAPKIPGWSTICGSVQDLYRLSLKEPCEFALVQTMLTVMHQDQTKEEIIKHMSEGVANCTGNHDPAEDEDQEIQLSEIRGEIERVSNRINEQASALQSLQLRVDQLAINFGTRSENVPNEEAIWISHTHIHDIEIFLTRKFGGVQVDADSLNGLFIAFYKKLGYYRDINFKAKEYSDPGVPTAVVFVLTALAMGLHCEGIGHIQKEIGKSFRHLNPVEPCVERVIKNSIRKSH